MPEQVEIQQSSNEIQPPVEPARQAYSRPTVETLDVQATHAKLSPVAETVFTGS